MLEGTGPESNSTGCFGIPGTEIKGMSKKEAWEKIKELNDTINAVDYAVDYAYNHDPHL